MDWSDEPWIKLYRRDTADWMLLSWQARGVFCLLLRAVSRAGTLDLGKSGAKAVAIHLRASWPEIEAPLNELLSDGCVTIRDGVLVVPNFLTAQEAVQSDRVRAQTARERRRDLALGDENVTKRDASITPRDETVTRGHAASRGVTRGHAASLREEKRRDEKSGEGEEGSAEGSANAPPAASCRTKEPLTASFAAEVLSALSLRATGDHELELLHVLQDVAARGQGVTLAAARRLAAHLAAHMRPGSDGKAWRPTLHHMRGKDGRWTLFLSLLSESETCGRCDVESGQKAPQNARKRHHALIALETAPTLSPEEEAQRRAALAALRQSINNGVSK
jgi:hypothetical protein